MINPRKWLNCSILIVLLAITDSASKNLYAAESMVPLEWRIETTKKTFYPGEPILLNLQIQNKGEHSDKIDFGEEGIAAFTMEICNQEGMTVSKGYRIRGDGGLGRVGTLEVSPDKIVQKSIVLNRWCSTLLPAGNYTVRCGIEYRSRSEAERIPGAPNIFTPGPLHTVQLTLGVVLMKVDSSKYRDILKDLEERETQGSGQSFDEWRKQREIERNMIAFTEWKDAVPYQLHLLRVAKYTKLRWDIINSLVRSNTVDAAVGLIQIMNDPSVYKDDVQQQIVIAVHKLRETGNPQILEVTEGFIKEVDHKKAAEIK